MQSLLSKIDFSNLPEHIAVIMDGNGRWAKKQNKPRIYGHQSAIDAVQAVIKACGSAKIKYLTLYAFSTENWNRSASEVNMLFDLLSKTIQNELDTFLEEEIKLLIIGNRTKIPEKVNQSLDEIVEKTKHHTRGTLTVALDYGSKEEIISSVKKIANLVKQNTIEIEDINESLFENNLYTENLPKVDLLIRTSGEQRISNFLLWQIAYAELYFTPVLWPDFREIDLYKAIIEYQSRERRYGGV